MLATPMPSLSPRTTLLLLFALAAVIFAAGLRVSRVKESVRIDRDREPLRRFSGEVQAELQRLDALYESHLDRVVRTAPPTDAFAVRRDADRIVGIRQWSLLHRVAAKMEDVHVQVIAVPGERTPRPMFSAPRAGAMRAPVLLAEEKYFDEREWSGWIDEPGKPLMYWQRDSSEAVVVLLIDVPAVAKAIDGWLAKWAAERFGPVRVGGGPDALRSFNGRALLAEGDATATRPDLLLPLRSRLGAWELASWDCRETRIRYDRATLTASSALAVLVALLAFVLVAQQRRTLVLAAQRVSFVNRVSHELRAPLTNILLNVDLAAESADPQRRLALVQEEARRLGRLIDNVLTFSRHEQGKLRADPHACIPASVIAAVTGQFAPSFARRALEIRTTGDLSAPCRLDADALAQILANLLSNVEKYVPGGPVEIAGTLANGTLAITVNDEGPGIPAEAAERIFRPFERLDSRVNEGASGTGLGLAIARDLAASMGSTLSLLPSAKGAAFELRVPAPLAEKPSVISAA